MTTSFGGDSQPDPSIDDAGYGHGELPVEPTIVDRLGGLASAVNTVSAVTADGSAVGIDDPGSWRPSEWPAASEHPIEPNTLVQQSQQAQPQQPAVPPLPPLDQQHQQFDQSQPYPYPPQDYPAHSQPAHQGQPAERSQWYPPVQPAATGPTGDYPPVEFVDSLPYDPSDDFGDEASRVRPYAWTGGRTRSSVDLQLETLVSTSEIGQDEAALTQVEYRAVGTLCRHPHSVAEVAAKLSVPLGVAKVILSDMAELGLISIHRTFADDDIAAHLVLMERVLSGLRRL